MGPRHGPRTPPRTSPKSGLTITNGRTILLTMRKGEETREAILVHALGLATKVGFEGLTIGRLADDLELSKSGLFAHFKSKENLQVQVLEMASRRFIDEEIGRA